MEIDPHNLPKEAGILRQIVLQLLGVVEEKDRLLERVQHQLQQLLRQRYGPKRERIDENQLFLFAAQIIAAARQAKAAEPGAQGSGASGTTRRAHGKGHGRKPLPASLERRRVVFDLEEKKCGPSTPASAVVAWSQPRSQRRPSRKACLDQDCWPRSRLANMAIICRCTG